MHLTLIRRQATYKWLVTLLLFLAITASVSLNTYIRNTSIYMNRSMQLIVKNMGHNLLYMPGETNPFDMYGCTGGEKAFPDKVAELLARHKELASRYFVAVLQEKWTASDGKTYLLTGIRPVERKDETAEKANMIRPLSGNAIRLGASVARHLNIGQGSELWIQGKAFNVTGVMDEKGNVDDFRIYLPLGRLQEMTGRVDSIHFIMAFLCQHSEDVPKALAQERLLLSGIAPDLKLIAKTDILQGRNLARTTTSRSLYYLLGLIFAVALLIIIITGLQEVAERRKEAGVLTALGAGPGYIVSLYMIKIGVLAAGAALTGFFMGSFMAVHWTSGFLVTETVPVTFQWADLPETIIITVLAALAAESVPVISLIRSDPGTVLTEE
ncbi:MAG: FtsX-like permease family protein [Fibrobacterota bacterium]